MEKLIYKSKFTAVYREYIIYIYSSRNFEPFITGEAPPNDNDNSNLNDSNDTNYVTHGTGKSALAGFRLFIVGIM